MADKKVSVNDMLAQVQDWYSEAINFRNDGYTQEHYRQNILAMHARLKDIVGAIELSTDRLEETGIAATKPEARSYRNDPRTVYAEDE
jgi:hypothetical protein|tara:strand:- start:959 stop:1222 length:264 start_codon:yes stop_codon:yes gene_type:complete